MKWKNGKIGIKKMAKTTCPNVNEFSSFEEVTRRGWVLLALPCLNVCVCVYNLQMRKTPKYIPFFYKFYYYLRDTFLGQVGGALFISRLPIHFFVSSIPTLSMLKPPHYRWQFTSKLPHQNCPIQVFPTLKWE